MGKYTTCVYCKKERLACLFMTMKSRRYKMCNWCQKCFRLGKELIGTKWKGYRFSETPEARKLQMEKRQEKIKPQRLYSPLTKEQRERVAMVTNNDMWPEDYLPD